MGRSTFFLLTRPNCNNENKYSEFGIQYQVTVLQSSAASGNTPIPASADRGRISGGTSKQSRHVVNSLNLECTDVTNSSSDPNNRGATDRGWPGDC